MNNFRAAKGSREKPLLTPSLICAHRQGFLLEIQSVELDRWHECGWLEPGHFRSSTENRVKTPPCRGLRWVSELQAGLSGIIFALQSRQG